MGITSQNARSILDTTKTEEDRNEVIRIVDSFLGESDEDFDDFKDEVKEENIEKATDIYAELEVNSLAQYFLDNTFSVVGEVREILQFMYNNDEYTDEDFDSILESYSLESVILTEKIIEAFYKIHQRY